MQMQVAELQDKLQQVMHSAQAEARVQVLQNTAYLQEKLCKAESICK